MLNDKEKMLNDKENVCVLDGRGKPIDYEAACNLMDDDIASALHAEMAPCTEQEFLDRYAIEHEAKFGVPFTPVAGGAW